MIIQEKMREGDRELMHTNREIKCERSLGLPLVAAASHTQHTHRSLFGVLRLRVMKSTHFLQYIYISSYPFQNVKGKGGRREEAKQKKLN